MLYWVSVGIQDKFKRQIDQMARALANLLADVVGKNKLSEIHEDVNRHNEQLKAIHQFDLNDLLACSDDEFEKKVSSRNFSEEQLGLLADIFFTLAQKQNNDHALYQKALVAYEMAQKSSRNYSMALHSRMEEIRKALKDTH